MLREHAATRESWTCTRLNNHRVGRNSDRRLGQCSSSKARSEVFSEAAGCLSGTYTGLEEKYIFGLARELSVPREEPMVMKEEAGHTT